MTSRNLEHLLAPRSVALIGASDRAHSVGATVMRNLLSAGFQGPIWPVNPKHASVAGLQAYPDVARLPETPDLAVLCTPAPTVPGLITALGRRGTRAAAVIASGLEQRGPDGRTWSEGMLQAAQPFRLRILGPNGIGLLVPPLGLNASFAHVGARPGHLAFVGQSGAVMTALLDWARSGDAGFSCVIDIGNAADVDFGDLLDHLGRDPGTRAILLYMESLSAPRKFLSAARAAARVKPVIAVKAGRSAVAAAAALSHTGALAGTDGVYEAAFRRAGILRVDTLRELLDAAEILPRWTGWCGPRLAIVTNGGGPAVLATDALVRSGGTLAALSDATVQTLDALLPGSAPHANPVDVGGDAVPERYAGALEAVAADPGTDALLVMHAPTALAGVAEVASAVLPVLAQLRCPAMACWLGEGGAVSPAAGGDAGGAATAAGVPVPLNVPVYNTPEEAVEAFRHVVRHHQSQAQLLEVPATLAGAGRADADAARALVAAALAGGRSTLTGPEALELLAAYAIPVALARSAPQPEALAAVAHEIGFPVALKILSPDIPHKSDVGGVALDIADPGALQQAAAAMLHRCRQRAPAARLEGFLVQKMIRRGGAHELLAGIATDPTFGPVILFGQGGTAVEVIADRAAALPPLNAALARDLIAQTRVARLLAGYRERPPADLAALERTLVALAQLAADIPQVAELDINPLLADAGGVMALDVRVRLAPSSVAGPDRLAIRPYPAELEERVPWAGRELLLRPIRPEDFAQQRRFLARVTPHDLRERFFEAMRALPDRDLARYTQLDYDREMAFIAVTEEHGSPETLGVGRCAADPDNTEAEIAVLVRSDLQGQGLGKLLIDKLIRYCRGRGIARLVCQVASHNLRMLHLAQHCGFKGSRQHGDVMLLELALQPPAT